VRERLEDAPAAPDGSFNQSAVDQEQEHDGSLMERHSRPVTGVGQIIFQMQSRIANRFLQKSCAMLVITVKRVMRELSFPVAR
jgi:phage gp36-like protein